MQGEVYVEHKICKFGRNPLSTFYDTKGRIRQDFGTRK